MKKTAATLLLAVFLIGGSVKPASAQLILDPTQLLGKISDFVEKVSDTTSKITQQINQIKMMSIQGFSLGELIDVQKYYNIATGFLSKKISQLVTGTSEKQKAALQEDADAYKRGREAMFDKKIEETQKSQSLVNDALSAKKDERKNKERECERLASAVTSETDIVKASEKNSKLITCQMQLDRIDSEIKDMEKTKEKLSNQITELQNQRSKIGTDEDKGWKEKEARIPALEAEAAKEKEGFLAAEETSGDKEWDNPEATKDIDFDKVSKEFVEQYFYDPQLVDGKTTLEYQSNLDRIYRERRYLFVNTAAHLLQAATTIRREIPARTFAVDKAAEVSVGGENEDVAIAAYANTRVEEIKTLLLYAQLLSIRLQYLAVRDLLETDAKKEYVGKSFSDFDLEKYIVDDQYIKDLLEEAKKGMLDGKSNKLDPTYNKDLVKFSLPTGDSGNN